MVVTRQIGRAMAEQVTRVNGDPERLIARVEELEAENERLRRVIADLRNQVVQQAGDVDYLRESSRKTRSRGWGAISINEAAHRAGVSVSTAWRYCKCGHWQAVQRDGRHWEVFTDQTLQPKPRGGKRVANRA